MRRTSSKEKMDSEQGGRQGSDSKFLCFHCKEHIVEVQGEFSGLFFKDANGNKFHEECWYKLESSSAATCVHCKEPLLYVSGRFGGDYYELENGKVHTECWSMYSIGAYEKCAHCNQPCCWSEQHSGEIFEVGGVSVHEECVKPYITVQRAKVPRPADIKADLSCAHCGEKIVKLRGKFSGACHTMKNNLHFHEECWNDYYRIHCCSQCKELLESTESRINNTPKQCAKCSAAQLAQAGQIAKSHTVQSKRVEKGTIEDETSSQTEEAKTPPLFAAITHVCDALNSTNSLYSISIKLQNNSWVLLRQYNDFTALSNDLKKEGHQLVNVLPLPVTGLFQKLNPLAQQDLQNNLQIFLNEVTSSIILENSQALQKFFETDGKTRLIANEQEELEKFDMSCYNDSPLHKPQSLFAEWECGLERFMGCNRMLFCSGYETSTAPTPEEVESASEATHSLNIFSLFKKLSLNETELPAPASNIKGSLLEQNTKASLRSAQLSLTLRKFPGDTEGIAHFGFKALVNEALVDATNNVYKYPVQVTYNEATWQIHRRYEDFVQLYNALKGEGRQLSGLNVSWDPFGSSNLAALKEHLPKLQRLLNTALQETSVKDSELLTQFLEADQNQHFLPVCLHCKLMIFDSGVFRGSYYDVDTSEEFKNELLPQCPGRHSLRTYTLPKTPVVASCDVCHTDIPSGGKAMGCRPCDFHICETCNGNILKKQGKVHQECLYAFLRSSHPICLYCNEPCCQFTNYSGKIFELRDGYVHFECLRNHQAGSAGPCMACGGVRSQEEQTPSAGDYVTYDAEGCLHCKKEVEDQNMSASLNVKQTQAQCINAKVTSHSKVQSSGNSMNVCYHIEVITSEGLSIFLQRRYSEFEELYKILIEKHQLQAIKEFSFPRKSMLFENEDDLCSARQHAFNAFLQLIVCLEPVPRAALDFLHLKETHVVGKKTISYSACES